MTEKQLQAELMLKIGGRPDVRLFRNTCGFGYQGTPVGVPADTMTLKNPRPVTFGLMPGSADLIGWVVVGGKAVFLSIEVKGPRGRASKAQVAWAAQIKKMGGVAGIVKSVEEAEALIENHKPLKED